MSDLAGLLRAVLARPDDDVPRLLYADEVERTCPERAEFIRVQCRAAHLESEAGGAHVDHPEAELNCVACALVSTLRRRERELLSEYRDADGWSYWARWAPEWFRHVRGIDWSYCRGFVSQITHSWADWSKHAGELLASCPLTGLDSLVRLTTWPELERERWTNRMRLAGRKWYTLDELSAMPGGATDDSNLILLRAEWPGVRFELPRVDIRDEAQRQVDAAVANLRARGYDVGPASRVEVVP